LLSLVISFFLGFRWNLANKTGKKQLVRPAEQTAAELQRKWWKIRARECFIYKNGSRAAAEEAAERGPGP
jgi:hypothetical protein